MKIVKSLPMLNRMAKKGFIKLHPQTGQKIKNYGGKKTFIIHYVKDGTRYFSGCFYPFVVEIG